MNNSTTSSQPSIAEPPRPNDYESRSMASQNKNSLFQKVENIASLSQVVRAFGACAIIASMSLFMFQGWAEGNDVMRYLKLLVQTGLLTSAGLISISWTEKLQSKAGINLRSALSATCQLPSTISPSKPTVQTQQLNTSVNTAFFGIVVEGQTVMPN